MPRGAFLSVSRPAGRRALWCLIWLALIISLAETLARSDAVQSLLPAPSYGMVNRQFELQWDRLRTFVAQGGQPDCIFLGSSQMLRGVDPLAFAAAYREETGREPRCFNLGVRGLDPVNTYKAALLLLQENNPRLLIIGTDIPSYSVQRADRLRDKAFSEQVWVRYRLGEPLVEGWLIDHSAALRAYLPKRFYFTIGHDAQQVDAEEFDAVITREGFGPTDFKSKVLGEPPGADDPQAELFEGLQDFQLASDQLAALEATLALRVRVPVIILELPLHSTFMHFFGNGRADYERGLQAIRDRIAPAPVDFVETTDQNIVPDSGWANRNHLNAQGAETFSRWLGAHLAGLTLDGTLPSLAGVTR